MEVSTAQYSPKTHCVTCSDYNDATIHILTSLPVEPSTGVPYLKSSVLSDYNLAYLGASESYAAYALGNSNI